MANDYRGQKGPMGTNGLRVYRSESGQSKLSFGAFRGNCSMTIFKGQPGSGTRPVYISVNPELKFMLTEVLSEIIKAAPNARMPILVKEYDKNATPPGYKLKTTINIGKSDNGVVYIEITGEDNAPEKFPLRGTKVLELSSGDNGDQARSKRQASELLRFMLNEWSTAAIVSRTAGDTSDNRSSDNKYAKRPSAPEPTAASDGSEDMDIY